MRGREKYSRAVRRKIRRLHRTEPETGVIPEPHTQTVTCSSACPSLPPVTATTHVAGAPPRLSLTVCDCIFVCMEPQPQQSLQPDPPDDDPDQDPDQPPPHPSPALLDSALSLVAQPLASAAVRVAASHPLPPPLDDLNDFNVDLSWATPDIDSLFLNDTQYLQLGDDQAPSTPAPAPSTPLPTHQHPHPSVSTTVTATITQPTTATQNDPPPRRSRSSTPSQTRSRPRSVQPSHKQNPIPIAPRTLNNPKPSPPTPRSTQAQSSPLPCKPPKSAPPVRSPEPSPASVSPDNPAHFPFPVPAQPMIPIMNMYPLQHHQSAFQSSPPTLSPTDPNTPHSKLVTPSASNPLPTSNSRFPNPQLPTSAPQHSTLPHTVAHNHQFLSPTMQLMPQRVVPYDPGVMPLFQMAYAAAAAGYPQGIIPPITAASPTLPSTMLTPFGPTRPQSIQHDNSQNISAPPTDASTISQPTAQQPPRSHSKPSGAPVLVHDNGTQVIVPQQKAARLERHPVLGRLQLKSTSKPQDATAPSEVRFVSETQPSSGDNQQKRFSDSNPQAADSPSRPGSASLGSSDGGQRQQKKRLVWTPELHDRFVKAISAVGLSQAVPKTLVTIMNVEGLTTEHVKSHLQKYRNSLRKEAAEEDRDRSRGAGPSTGPHNLKLGTPGASGASVIRTVGIVNRPGSATNNNGHQGGTAVTDRQTGGEPQRLPILPCRISAFGGQVGGVIQPTLEAKASTPGTKPKSAPQAVLESNQGMERSISPQAPSVHSPKRADIEKGRASDSSIAAGQASQAPKGVLQGDDGDVMEMDQKVFAGEKTKAVGQSFVTGNELQDSRNTSTGHEDGETAGVGSCPGEVEADGLQICGTGSRTKEGIGEKDEENVGSESQGKRDAELEVMKEETQQMQLQVQMMIHRTIALEKKLEELHSERLNVEGIGTADGSRRSTAGDANRSGGESGNVVMKDEEPGNKGVGEDGSKKDEAVETGNRMGEETARGDDKDKEKERTRKRRYPSGSNDHCEVKALLSEQMGLQKRIADGLAMIDKRMRREGDEMMASNATDARKEKVRNNFEDERV